MRALAFLRWLVPGAVLALLPKCPACLAAWVAFSTGIGLSLPAAANIRLFLMVACAAPLCYLLTRKVCRTLASAHLQRKTNHC